MGKSKTKDGSKANSDAATDDMVIKPTKVGIGLQKNRASTYTRNIRAICVQQHVQTLATPYHATGHPTPGHIQVANPPEKL